jgi:hypothetical protein
VEKKRFKYQINHFLSIQPIHFHAATMSRKLLIEHNIPPAVFHRDRTLEVGNPDEIPSERLEIYAVMLGVSTAQLLGNSES